MATIVTTSNVGPEPTVMVCPNCKASVTTQTKSRSNTRTHIYAALLCLLMCWPCVCLPYCCASCQDTIHTCPGCKTFIGVYTR